ncbi:c-type cytochrome [Lacimicrobium sp. SS2-24]|uniref:c-type cytochrome n=1 Tax=Lacimicrobium sp. SS2-24 TaxID=2005569 RepID=UPI001FEE229A|nr:c-type cytochrome [Lacimicrobium sp. SS2-24]
MKIKTLMMLGIGLVVAFAGQAYDASEDAIKERIKPIGQVRVAGAEAETASADAGPRSGQEIYQASCFACHGTGAMGAPKSQVADDWAPRMEQGFDTMLSNAINGIGAMPPMGTCANCSEDDIKAAIEHMIDGL